MSRGLPIGDLLAVVDYMETAGEVKAAAQAVLEAADHQIQVRLGDPDGELQAVVPWPVLERLRAAVAR